jgi:hypothetical protein
LIELHDRKQADELFRHLVILTTTTSLGYNNLKTWAEQKKMAIATCMLVSYDLGYKKVLAMMQVHEWINKFNNAVMGLPKNILAF